MTTFSISGIARKASRALLVTLLGFSGVAQGAVLESLVYSPTGAAPIYEKYPSRLILASNGELWGTTNRGGPYDSGTIFKITTGGAYSTQFSFGSVNPYDDGGRPSSIIEGASGVFYGTAEAKGTYGYGVIFRLDSVGGFHVLKSFTGNAAADGSFPRKLAKANNNLFYGVTVGGSGSIFKIDSAGNFTTLYRFGTQPFDGMYPNSLVMGSDGNLYGTTYNGGQYGQGTIFKFVPSTQQLTVLYQFGSIGADLSRAVSLIQQSSGVLYGTSWEGGNFGKGGIFKITTGGTYTLAYHCGTVANDCYAPQGLAVAANGTMYGTSYSSGANAKGTAFSLTPAHVFMLLYSFGATVSDVAKPSSEPVLGGSNLLYGTGNEGGGAGFGAIYKIQY
ncbi:choice-of-anchor tandem repeat GloVer-containing protein [Solimonas fluminis]|nr:choice-of-anchor tandem repeat GloVer-containing protein [Solimonas fluminis]